MARLRILLVLFNDTAAKGILDSSSIESLAAAGSLDLIHAMPIEGVGKYFNRVYQWPRASKREQAWMALYQFHLMPFTRAHYPERLADPTLWQGLDPYTRQLLKVLDNRVGRATVAPLLRWYLKRTNPLPSLIQETYDVVICVTGLKDPLYEDVVRFARDRRMPVLAITQNWDNVNYKPIVERPDMLGVWGMQGYYVARLLHRLPHERLVPVGAARMDVYFKELPSQLDSRRELGLPEGRPILLFAGAGPQFDETYVVEELDAAISDGRLPSDLLLLYKPHPKRAPRPKEKPLDITKLRNVRIVPPTGPGSVSVGKMPVLLRAIDAIASPMSTMLFESALCGRPCLAIGYDDPNHQAVKWASALRHIHLTPLLFAPWALTCARKETIISDISRLLTMTGNEELRQRAREDMLHVLHYDGRNFGLRVADAARQLLKSLNRGVVGDRREAQSG